MPGLHSGVVDKRQSLQHSTAVSWGCGSSYHLFNVVLGFLHNHAPIPIVKGYNIVLYVLFPEDEL